MSDRPQPPQGSVCLDSYETGAQVYYYRSGMNSDQFAACNIANSAAMLQVVGAVGRSEALRVAEIDML